MRTPTIYLDDSSRQSDHRPLFHELAKGGREGISILILCRKPDDQRATFPLSLQPAGDHFSTRSAACKGDPLRENVLLLLEFIVDCGGGV